MSSDRHQINIKDNIDVPHCHSAVRHDHNGEQLKKHFLRLKRFTSAYERLRLLRVVDYSLRYYASFVKASIFVGYIFSRNHRACCIITTCVRRAGNQCRGRLLDEQWSFPTPADSR